MSTLDTSRDSLLGALQTAVERNNRERARELYETLQLRYPLDAAAIIALFALSDEDATAIGAA